MNNIIFIVILHDSFPKSMSLFNIACYFLGFELLFYSELEIWFFLVDILKICKK